MDPLFTHTLDGWESWGRVFHSPEAFGPLVREILRREHLPAVPPENCRPGTNAVFRCGGHIVKIFAPLESGPDTAADYKVECYGLEQAGKAGAAAPAVVAAGEIRDRYLFRYLILERIDGVEFGAARPFLSDSGKEAAGRQVREILEKLQAIPPCPDAPDAAGRAADNKRWSAFPESFRKGRTAFLNALPRRRRGFVHGDLTGDNVLISNSRKLYVIDFADACAAPPEYELPPVLFDLFAFDPLLLGGCFGQMNRNELADRCFESLLLHDFGANIVQDGFGPASQYQTLAQLREELLRKLSRAL
ncbi:MAG: aminoglycoside phosphotransferase family protein [Lentisphaeria bacterium]|nr:aminoglycoside phosphotransferase family protein [Lentisphaeria bacterium]